MDWVKLGMQANICVGRGYGRISKMFRVLTSLALALRYCYISWTLPVSRQNCTRHPISAAMITAQPQAVRQASPK
jgi:hypothetical protein